MNATAIQTANNTQPCFRKTIDKTTYVVRVHFSETAKETMQDKIKRLLRELPAEQSEVIMMRTAQHLSFAEIAEVLDVPISTAKSRFAYGIDKVRKMLNDKK